jgi:hypothetical protein
VGKGLLGRGKERFMAEEVAGERERELKERIEKLEALISKLTDPSLKLALDPWLLAQPFVRAPGYYGGGPGAMVYPGYSPAYPTINNPSLVLGGGPYVPSMNIAGTPSTLSDSVSFALNELRLDIADIQLTLSESVALRSVAMRRVVQVSVFISSSSVDDLVKVWDAIELIFDAINCTVYAKGNSESGSWYERWLGRTRDVVTSEAVIERLGKLERAAELRGIDNPQADADLKTAKAVRELLRGLESSTTLWLLLAQYAYLNAKG